MKNEDLIKIGFQELPHLTVTNAVIYDLGRRRQLSIGCAGTPNEMVFICEIDRSDDKKITDLICLHNYDYDGYLTETKIKTIIMAITGNTEFAPAAPPR